MSQTGTLYLVPTPIGNLEDITRRAEKVLGEVDIVACEDTRHSGQLLSRLQLKKKLVSYHEHNEQARAGELVAMLLEGQSVAVITDAGSPGISDPGYRIVRAAVENNIVIVPLPGANSIIPALTVSGLPTDRFLFEGYLSHKSSARLKRLDELKDFPHTMIFFESPFRVGKCLDNMLTVLGDRPVCVAREMTKLHEEFIRGGLKEVSAKLQSKKVKGEIVIVVAGKSYDRKSKADGNE